MCIVADAPSPRLASPQELEPDIRGEQTLNLVMALGIIGAVVVPMILVTFCVCGPFAK